MVWQTLTLTEVTLPAVILHAYLPNLLNFFPLFQFFVHVTLRMKRDSTLFIVCGYVEDA